MLKFFVRDMLDFQQIKANKMIKDIFEFEIRECIDEVIQMQQYIASKNDIFLKIEYIHLDLIEDILFKINLDRLRLQQILLNLLSNALKYT